MILTRRVNKKPHGNVRYVHWDARTLGKWTFELEGSDLVVNLVGKSVNCRYTAKNKAEIIRSRVDATTAIGLAIQHARVPPRVWINAGSAAIFGNSGNEVKTEGSALGDGFSPEVCKAWESAFGKVYTPSTRKIFLRMGIVIQSERGILVPFVRLVRFGLGGAIGNGRQYISWIHETDLQRLIKWLLANDHIQGIVHAASPHPVTNEAFMRVLRKVNKVPLGIPTPSFLVKVGALFIGTEAELVLSGRRVVSRVLNESGFEFSYPYLEEALLAIY